MESSSKPTAVHYALVVFVLISLVCGLGWLLAYKGANSIGELERKARDEQRKADEQTKLASALLDDLHRIKTLLNSNFSEVGDKSTPNTVIWDMQEHIRNYGGGEGADTYNDIIVKLAELKRNTTVSRDKLQEQLDTELAKFKREVEGLNASLTSAKNARDASNRARIEADIAFQEKNVRRDADITELRKAITAAHEQIDEERVAAKKTIDNLEKRMTNLVAINHQLTAALEEKTRETVDRPNGEVRWVDHLAKRVWVSLGKADGLKPQTTFSVYQKSHSGVGRAMENGQLGKQDIKGGIEITRVVKSDLSEARIVRENIYRPIAKGDPIYSPLWSSGRGEAFSIVGIIDLDGDGQDDREVLRQQVRSVGAVIDNEVDERGVLRVGGEIPGDGRPRFTEKTKYLVIGKIPEPADLADPAQMATAQKILGLRKDLEDAARERGVRVISLGDFLNYLGYKPRRGPTVPGDNGRIKPKSNSASATGNATSGGDASSAGAGTPLQRPRNTTSAKIFRQ